jgi:glycosyltransferase involved in cell wall biosynthesis
MKKIGLYLDSVVGGGVYQYNLSILNTVKYLSQNGFETVISYSNTDWGEYLDQENINAKRIPHTILSKIWFETHRPLSIWRKISPYIDQFSKCFINEKCDLWIFPSQDIWSYSLPIKTMVTVHDLMHRYEKRFPEAASKRMFNTRERHYSRISRYAKSILVDSKIGKNQMIESYGTDSKKIHVLPYIPPQYIFENYKSIDVHQFYGLPEKYFFYPAQFWSHKNHIALIEATSIIIKQYPDIYFVFVGSKKNGYESVIKSIQKLNISNSIKILNYVPNEHMPDLYKSARGMIMPTFYGPTNIPPLEAMALGCPVAISNIYAIPEQINKAGLLFNPNSVDEIVTIMKKLWTNDTLVEKLQKLGYQKSKNWQQFQFNRKFFNILNQVLENN